MPSWNLQLKEVLCAASQQVHPAPLHPAKYSQTEPSPLNFTDRGKAYKQALINAIKYTMKVYNLFHFHFPGRGREVSDGPEKVGVYTSTTEVMIV